MRKRLTFKKVMKRLEFGGKRDLIPNIQAHLKPSGGNVMTWACITSSGTDSLILTDDGAYDGSSKINSSLQKPFVCQFTKRCNQTDFQAAI